MVLRFLCAAVLVMSVIAIITFAGIWSRHVLTAESTAAEKHGGRLGERYENQKTVDDLVS